MDKETIKKIINDFIDSVDEIRDFSVTNETDGEELKDLSGNVYGKPKLSGITNVYITTYKG